MDVQIVSVVHVDRRSDECLDEIEDCWQLRDAGYNTIWVSEVRIETNKTAGVYFGTIVTTRVLLLKCALL